MLEIFAVKIPTQLDELLLSALTSFVDPLKQDRIRHFVHDADKYRTLFADLLVRSLLLRKTGLKNQEISFGENEFGKPYLLGGENFHFNISHSRDWVVVAVDSMPVGIDIEAIHPIEESVAEHVFSPIENEELMSQADFQSHFFSLWSLKESFIKMVGTGTRFPLHVFSVRWSTLNEIYIEIAGKPMEGVYLCEYDIDSNYKMGLCANHNHFPKHVAKIPAVTIIRNFIRVESTLPQKKGNDFLPM